MGSKTPDGHQQGPNHTPADAAIATVNPPKSAAASGLLEGTLEGEDEDGDDDDNSQNGANVNTNGASEGAAKKRKRNRKKKSKTPGQQTTPPRTALATLFPDKKFPPGEIVERVVDENLQRTTAEEIRHLAVLDDMDENFLRDYRKAAEVHRQVRAQVQKIAKPGVSMTELANEVEEGVRALVGHPGLETGDALKAGMGFPTGLCVNNIAAHWTPNAGVKDIILKHEDVLSVDFGVHVSGRIVDSAFTVAFDPVYDPLLAAAKACTNAGIKEAGIDARMDHLSEVMQEVMESYEMTLNGKTIPIKAVRNITGHNILRYKIHGDKQVPFYKSKTTQRMEEGDIFAIETFGTTGKGKMMDAPGVYGYGRNERANSSGLHLQAAKKLLRTIDANFGGIVFAKRYLERLGVENYHLGMRTLVREGVVEEYAPLVDVPGSHVAQFEHTILLRPNCKEVVSRGDDY